MMSCKNSCCYFPILVLILPFSLALSMTAEIFDYPSFANLSSSWPNVPSSDLSFWETNGVRPIFVNGMFVCGFHCSFVGDSCLFAVSIFKTSSDENAFSSQMVWSANRNNPVELQALLQLTAQGNLILEDGNGALVWSTNTEGKSVSSLNLSAEGNLMLFDKTNNLVWQSFDHPTDSLVVGQRLVTGQKLRSSVSSSNSSDGLYTLAIIDGNFTAYMEAYPHLVYYSAYTNPGQSYAEFRTGWFGGSNVADSASFIQLGNDGHLKVYEWKESEWQGVDLFDIGWCDYPLTCGNYGFCLGGGCSCPETDGEIKYFRPIDKNQLDLGCSAVLPISCEHADDQSLLELQDTSLAAPSYSYSMINTIKMSLEDCKAACLMNCSCKAALIARSVSINGSQETLCFLMSEVFSLRNSSHYVSNFGFIHDSRRGFDTVYLKVQNSSFSHGEVLNKKSSSPNSPERRRGDTAVILGSSLGAVFSVILTCSSLFLLRIRKGSKQVEEDYLDHISGMPARFSFEDLKVATKKFSNKLGGGGFGSVFQGTFPSGSEVAVKYLDGFGPVNKSFIAEVQTIGSIHHFNLVGLVGFCAEKYNRLLVYEYMPNGSLDQWIFNKNQEQALGWQVRKKIILDIAKGLAYLHEECNQKIIHLDIKPQNILLDENFNAKVSDFGLSKLIGRDESQVITTMRGTPGYMAPEWLSSVITEKADVYSFGIVVLEILCGRRNVDGSQQEEDRHLLSLFRRKQEEGQLHDLVDKCNDEMQSNADEVVAIMKVAAWCLQTEYARRPSMSTVVKIFEGTTNLAGDLGDKVLNESINPEKVETLSAVAPSVLSGPR